jgi:hypothetical protein
MLEKYLEEKLRASVKRLGGLALKFTSPGFNSVPDRVILFNGRTWFVEVKRPGQKPTPEQRICHQKFLSLGIRVWVVSSDETLKEFLDELQSV